MKFVFSMQSMRQIFGLFPLNESDSLQAFDHISFSQQILSSLDTDFYKGAHLISFDAS